MSQWPDIAKLVQEWNFPRELEREPHELREALRGAIGARKRHEADHTLGKPSAVLVPLFTRDAQSHLWLLRRSETMRRHQGQVAFPGGTRDPEDESLLHTALREANEEVGLDRVHADVLGPLDDLVTGTGYVITPYVAWIDPAFVPIPSEVEVARVFSAPLRTFGGPPSGEFPKVGWQADGELVWGATCAMIINLVHVIRNLESPSTERP